MSWSVQPASPDVPPEALAAHLWNTDQKLNSFMFGRMEVLLDVLRCEWAQDRGLLCHKQSFTVMNGDKVLGLLTGHTAAEYGPNFEAAKTLQMGRLSPKDERHMVRSLYWMDRLFPVPCAGSYYVLELSTAPEARGMGIAKELIAAAKKRAVEQGCSRICLDVAADNDAVGFYRHLGFDVEIETRVPFLEEAYSIGVHLHMVWDLGVSS